MKKKNKSNRFVERNLSFSNRCCVSFLIPLILILLISKEAFSSAVKLMGSSAVGTYTQVSILLCLFAKEGAGCQRYTLPILSSDLNIRISPNIKGKVFPAGIKIENASLSLTGCARIYNGLCEFSASNQNPAIITLLS